MQERKRLYFLILLIAAVALVVCASAVYALYQAALTQQAQQLAEMVKSQARLMEAMAQHERQEHPGHPSESLLREVVDLIHSAFERYPGFGQSGAFILARREGDRIVFLSTQRNEMRHYPQSILFKGNETMPMHRALSGQSGAMIMTDYRGVPVLSAYEPVRELGLGMVAKIDLAEVRAPYVRAGIISGLLAAVAVMLGGLIVVRTTEPFLQRLRERKAMLDKAQEVAHVGCWSFDIPANRVVWSDELYRIFGYEPRSFTPSYELFTSHIHPEDRTRVIAAIAEGRARGGPFSYSYRLRRADGAERIVESHGEAFANDRGEVMRLFGVSQDVTERVDAKEKIRNIAWLPEQNPHPVLRARQTGTLIYANAASRHLCDRLGTQTGGPLPPEWMAVVTDAMKEKSPRTFEVACGDRHFMFIAWPIAGTDYVNFYGMDITERKQIEAALHESENNFRVLTESANVGILVNHRGRHVFANPQLLALLGYTADEIRQTGIQELVHPDECEKVMQRFRDRQAGRPAPAVYETVFVSKDGQPVPVEITATLTHWEGEPAGLVFLQDIRGRKRVEAEMRKLSRALEQSADAVMVTGRAGVIEYVNPALETMTGYARAELIGRKPNVFRSGIQDEAFYRRLWDTILRGEIFSDVLVNRRKDGALYYEEKLISPIKDDEGNITHFVATARDITERMAAQVRLAHLAHHDTLTELPNRALFLDRLKQALAHARWHGRLVAVIFLDLDRFKVINDTLGHDVGDRLLQQMSARLHSSVRERDTVARFGGDEFAILLDDMASDNDVGYVAQKVLDALKAAFNLDGRELYVSASLGISLYPNDGDDARALLKNADTAMYRAKEAGKNNYQFYSADMSAQALERLTLESSLRHALGRNEFMLHYQPQVDARSGAVLGVEALLRWRHPERGLIGPSDYISLLEETGLILSVGEWVLMTACEQLRAWHAAGWSDLRLAVNLSARQVADPGFVGLLERLVTQHGCIAGKLELEITESVLMQHSRHALENIEAAHRLGLRIALDDFGTGYSSLSYLQRFPIDTLKIDRSFIRDLPGDADDALLTEAILNMARSLRIEVIAEGVETAAQRDFLGTRGCHYMQGYFFGRPVSAPEIARRVPVAGTGVN